MATERLAPAAILQQSNLTGALSAIQDDPDSPDANWLTSPALQSTDTDNYYPTGTAATIIMAPYVKGSAPSDSAFSPITGWTVAGPNDRATNGNASTLRHGTDRGIGTFNTTLDPGPPVLVAPGSAYRIGPLNGKFNAGTWTFELGLRANDQGFDGRGRLRYDIHKGSDPESSPFTFLGNSIGDITTANIGTGATTILTASWVAPEIVLTNEYIFITTSFNITTTPTFASTGRRRELRVWEGSGSRVITPGFTPIEPNPSLRTSFPTPSKPLTLGTGLQEFRVRARKKGTGPNPRFIIQMWENGVFISTRLDTTISNTIGQVLSGIWDANQLSDKTGSTAQCRVFVYGEVGASADIGAVEWNATIVDPQSYLKDITVINSGNLSIKRNIGKRFLLSSLSQLNVARAIGKILLSGTTSQLTARRGIGKGLTIISTSELIFNKLSSLSRVISAFSTSDTSLLQLKSYLRSIETSSLSNIEIVREIAKIISLSSLSTTSLERFKGRLINIILSSPSSLELNKLSSLLRTIDTASPSNVDIKALGRMIRTISFSSTSTTSLRKSFIKILNLSSVSQVLLEDAKNLSQLIFITSESEFSIIRRIALTLEAISTSNFLTLVSRAQMIIIHATSVSELGIQRHLSKIMKLQSDSNVFIQRVLDKLIEVRSRSNMMMKIGDAYIIMIHLANNSNLSTVKRMSKTISFANTSRIMRPVFATIEKFKKLVNRIGV